MVRSFLEAARERPDDDVPRLVLADWLDENGDDVDRARAEHIRTQCQLARPGLVAPGLEAREKLLEAQYAGDWLGPLRRLAERCQFRRGLVHLSLTGLACYRPDLHELALTETYAWVEQLTFLRLTGGAVPALVRMPLLRGVRALSLDDSRLGSSGLELLLTSPHLAGLRELRLAFCSVQPRGVAALAHATGLPALEALDLSHNHTSGEALGELAQATGLPKLRALSLAFLHLTDEAAVALSSGLLLGQLEALDLEGNGELGDRGLTALVSSPRAARLTSLQLGRTRAGL